MAYEILWRIHAVLMGTSFISLLSGILISLIWKKKKWRYKTHKALGIYAGSAGAAALITAFIMVQISSGSHLGSPHAVGGAAAGLLLILTPLAGLRIRKTRKKKLFRRLHKSMGYTTAVLMAAAILFGLLFAGVITLPDRPSTAAVPAGNSVTLSGITFSWEISGGYLEGTLEAETEGWIALGIQPDQMMQGADFIIGYVKDDVVYIRDDYGSWLTSHASDSSLGGTDDIEITGGEENRNGTVIRFRKPLDSGDRYDRIITPGETVPLLLASGAKDDYTGMHRNRGKTEITF